MKQVLGTLLTPEDQKHVLAAYVHRFTREHYPDWAQKPMEGGRSYPPVQFASDADWLANTRFSVKANGRLNHRVHECQSSQTWPDNPELRTKAA